MISGSTQWSTGLNAQACRPLLVFRIPGLSIGLCSFINQMLPNPNPNPSATLTDLSASGPFTTTLTSVTGGFTPSMVNAWLVITGGTNLTPGNYLITGWNSTNSITVASTPASGGSSNGVATVRMALNADAFLPTLQPITGSSQKVDELTGNSSISNLTITAIDNSGALKTLSANTNAIGQVCTLFMGFQGGDFNNSPPTQTSPSNWDFVPVEVKTIAEIGRDQNGVMTFALNDLFMNMVNDIFMNGGPAAYTQFTTAAQLSLTSSGATDLRLVVVWGFDGSGNYLTENIILTGSTEVLSVNTYALLQSVTIGPNYAASQIWTVTMRQGSGGTVISTIPVGSISGTGTGGIAPFPSVPPAFLDNGVPISSANPRYLSGNPIDIWLAVMQNELGIGQSAPPLLVVNTGGGSGTGQAGYGINPTWTFYNGTSGLINPNKYIDVPSVLALRDSQFSGDRMEFTMTGSETGKSWLEDQILKPLGLTVIQHANGLLTLKSMKQPAAPTSQAISNRQIFGIPQLDRWAIINILNATIAQSSDTTSDSSDVPVPFANQLSLNKYKSPYATEMQSDGLRLGLGGFQKLFLLSNRIFNRHGFGTPVYGFGAFLNQFVMEIGEFFVLTHPLLLDEISGTLGVTNVLCEIIDRQPDYTKGTVKYSVADTRFMSVSNGAFQIAAAGAGIPVYGSATTLQRATYMFVALNTGLYSTGAVGNELA